MLHSVVYLKSMPPNKPKSTQFRRQAPWVSIEILLATRGRRYLEIIWRRTRSPIDRSRYIKHLHICDVKGKTVSVIHISYQHILGKLANRGNSIIRTLHRVKPKVQPDASSLANLCSMFSKYFMYQIAHIRSCFVINNVDYHVTEHRFLAIHCNGQLLLKLVT